MNRRTFTLSLLALSASAAMGGLAGCGFELRRAPHMSFKSVQLAGFAANSPLAAELAKALEDAGVSVVESSAVAAAQQNIPAATAASNPRYLTSHLVLEALSAYREQAVASITAFSQVRDLSLRTRFRFRLTRADGSNIIVPTELLLTNDLPYNEKDALAKIDESAAMHRAMQTDIVQQVMRRLAVVRPDQLVAP